MIPVLAMAILLAVPVAAGAIAPPTDMKLLETISVPGNSTDQTPAPFAAEVLPDVEYVLRASGIVDTWPAKNYTVDPAYCFNVPNYCGDNAPFPYLQITNYIDGAYNGYTQFQPNPAGYDASHSYLMPYSFTSGKPYTLKLNVIDTQPEDNTGSFSVELYVHDEPIDTFGNLVATVRSKKPKVGSTYKLRARIPGWSKRPWPKLDGRYKDPLGRGTIYWERQYKTQWSRFTTSAVSPGYNPIHCVKAGTTVWRATLRDDARKIVRTSNTLRIRCMK